VEQAEHAARAKASQLFSLWRLRGVSVGQYLDDCQHWRRMFQGEPLRPAFLGPAPVAPVTKGPSREIVFD
jgi:hypothetical protein